MSERGRGDKVLGAISPLVVSCSVLSAVLPPNRMNAMDGDSGQRGRRETEEGVVWLQPPKLPPATKLISKLPSLPPPSLLQSTSPVYRSLVRPPGRTDCLSHSVICPSNSCVCTERGCCAAAAKLYTPSGSGFWMEAVKSLFSFLPSSPLDLIIRGHKTDFMHDRSLGTAAAATPRV